jgi:hypothetical protein
MIHEPNIQIKNIYFAPKKKTLIVINHLTNGK